MEREIFTAEFYREGGEGFLIQGNVTLRYSFSGALPCRKARRVAYLEGKSNCLDDRTGSFKSSLV